MSQIIDFRDVSSLSINLNIWVLLFMESSVCTICTYSDFFLVGKVYNSGLQIMPLFSDHLRFMASVDIGGS